MKSAERRGLFTFNTVSSFWATRSSAASSYGCRPARLAAGARLGALYAFPKEKSINRFMDQVRERIKRRIPLRTRELIEETNPLIRGWGEYARKLTSENSSIGSMVGSCAAYGRVGSSDGGTAAGNSCRKPSCTVNTGW